MVVRTPSTCSLRRGGWCGSLSCVGRITRSGNRGAVDAGFPKRSSCSVATATTYGAKQLRRGEVLANPVLVPNARIGHGRKIADKLSVGENGRDIISASVGNQGLPREPISAPLIRLD